MYIFTSIFRVEMEIGSFVTLSADAGMRQMDSRQWMPGWLEVQCCVVAADR